MEKIKIRNLSFFYPEETEPALCRLSLDINPGDFMVLCGPSGCGKSTLLRQLKSTMAPKGQREGEILFEGRPLSSLSQREESELIGFVQQSPENQIVTDKVWHELAFGLESLGLDTLTIRKRVAEMASFFGIEKWFYKKVTELSGGQKQLLNLASVMVMQPEILILDEPTSQLDPIAASDFLATVGKINRELGTTVILTEHRLEESLPLANVTAVMDHGTVIFSGSPKEAGLALREKGHSMFLAMPAAMRVWASVKNDLPCPVTVNEGRSWLADYEKDHKILPVPDQKIRSCGKETVLSLSELWFKYDKDLPDVVKGLNLEIKKGEFVSILGGNGTGKSTSLGLMAGLLKPYRGEVKSVGKMASLPQNPQTIFVKNTVRADLFEIYRGRNIPADEQEENVRHIVSICHLEKLLDRHPYDLSGGEQQRAALAKVLLLGPDILLLDEPTKGLDAEFKQELAGILNILLAKGVTIIMVSHDVEFCAKYSGRCCLFFDGSIVSSGTPREFFLGNSFYTTSAAKIARGIVDSAVTAEDLMSSVGGEIPEEYGVAEDMPELPKPDERSRDYKPSPLPLWRKLTAAVSLAAFAAVMIEALGVADLGTLVNSSGLTALAEGSIAKYIMAIVSLAVFAFSIGRRSKPSVMIEMPKEKRSLSKRTRTASAIILLLIPVTLFVGSYYLADRKYYFIALLILLECMIPFFMIFEDRKPSARELVLLAAIAAINVAGRSLFFMLPEFKPVFAITIIAGVSLGAETGFLIGSMTMLVSNIMFGQGPWTPWQMFALGIIGFAAGVLFRKGLLRRSRGSLCVFGAFSSIVIYGGLMNPASALIWASSGSFSWKTLIPYYVTGFPVDCVRAVSTALFLFFLAEPMLEKLERIKIKYGLMD